MTSKLAHLGAEQAVLSTILMIGEDAGYLIGLLEIDDFCYQPHRLIFEAMGYDMAKGLVPNPVTLAPYFQNDKIDGEPFTAYFPTLLQHRVPPWQALDCVKSLKEYSGRRTMMRVAAEMVSTAKKPTESIRDFNLQVIHALDEVCANVRAQKKTSLTIGDAARALIEKLRLGEKADVVDTGFPDLNAMLGGWHRGEMAIVAARPSMGKTTFMLSSLRQAAESGVTSVFFSLEMRTDAVMQRMFSDKIWNRDTPIPYVRIANSDLADYEIDRLEGYCEHFASLPLVIDDQPQMTVAELGVRARRVRDDLERRGQRLDVVCIDHLGKLRSTGRYEGNLVNETGEKSGDLAALARDLNVAMIVIHQLNRESERRNDSHPILADLRDSGNVEQDADTVCFVHREAYAMERTKISEHEEEMKRLKIIEELKNEMDLIIAKNRNGPCGAVPLFVDMSSNAVRNHLNKRYYDESNMRKLQVVG